MVWLLQATAYFLEKEQVSDYLDNLDAVICLIGNNTQHNVTPALTLTSALFALANSNLVLWNFTRI